jgi:hypothetical protein
MRYWIDGKHTNDQCLMKNITRVMTVHRQQAGKFLLKMFREIKKIKTVKKEGLQI